MLLTNISACRTPRSSTPPGLAIAAQEPAAGEELSEPNQQMGTAMAMASDDPSAVGSAMVDSSDVASGVVPVEYTEPALRVLPVQFTDPADAADPADAIDPPADVMTEPPLFDRGIPLPMRPEGPWRPLGMPLPWPRDEYLRDGGDQADRAGVLNGEWTVRGLDMEDCVAHYDTVDGRRLTEPTNPVYIYSPRFSAVRQVAGIQMNDHRTSTSDATQNQMLYGPKQTLVVAAAQQEVQAGRQQDTRFVRVDTADSFAGQVSENTRAAGVAHGLLPYENAKWVGLGRIDASNAAWLAKAAEAAIAWTSDEQALVVLDETGAMETVSEQKLQMTYTVKSKEGEAKLRVTKIASTAAAEPGDEVAFTIRFDNVGSEPIGNVTIIDSLTTRLQYVPGSGQCSVPANFVTTPNEGDSLVVRCEVTNPLEPGEGGYVRFRCIVR